MILRPKLTTSSSSYAARQTVHVTTDASPSSEDDNDPGDIDDADAAGVDATTTSTSGIGSEDAAQTRDFRERGTHRV